MLNVWEKLPITIAMDICVARQPIFDRKQKVVGYELLYRSGMVNGYDATDGTEASLAVIGNTFLFLGQRIVAPPSRAFINLTRDLLLNGIAGMLPAKSTVLEILEDIEPDETLMGVCRELKEAGYTLALDDYTIGNEIQHPLLELADIVKVDFMQNSGEECRVLVQNYVNDHRKLLAEKVETADAFKAALAMGYSFFQGSFFSKPVIVSGRTIPGYKLNYMRLLRETNRRELDFHTLEQVIKQDVTLCYTLLKYINSAYFGLRHQITSLLHALALLGEAEVRRWASIVLFTLTGADKPPQVVVRSLIRARMGELLAGEVGLKGHESELFLLGLFSMVDVLVGRPLEEILEGMNLSKEVTGALLGEQNGYRDLYELVVSYESGQWEQYAEHASTLNLDPERIPEIYVEATEWADEIARVGNRSS